MRTIHRVPPANQTYWNPYRSSLVKLINQKHDQYVQKFQTYINQKLKTLLYACIQNSARTFQNDIIDSTNEYIGAERFDADLELLKTSALDDFIHEFISLQQKSTKSKPTKESVRALNKHCDKVKNTLKVNIEYKGYELKHFQMIVPLLQRIMIFYHCFLAQLPLFNASVDLFKKIETNTVITIETTTGSGN